MPILTYRAEIWTWTKADISRIAATEMTFLRDIKERTRKSRIRNEKNERESKGKHFGKQTNK
jgi:hypothetical protein